MTGSAAPFHFDETSKVWSELFAAFLHCMLPVEYIYGDWFWWQAESKSKRSDDGVFSSLSTKDIETGSRVEGFCIPQFHLAKGGTSPFCASFAEVERWFPDSDIMFVKESFTENKKKEIIPIFTVEHVPDDPRYVMLRLSENWKEDRPRFKETEYLHHAFVLPEGKEERDMKFFPDQSSFDLHGPVRKLEIKSASGVTSFEADNTTVFEYPTAWPESAMEWLVRPRPNGWPSPELLQDIFESGCHLAPVGRGKRLQEPIKIIDYMKNPELSARVNNSLQKAPMDETEWRLSFSVAENKLGQSVSPVQRHVLVLLKMIKKLYFPEVISSYYLKNILFWECERKPETFWKEDNCFRCLLSMIGCLRECLENRCLPHYIIPESNLLENEEPVKLAEAASLVADVRKNIVRKTVDMLKRLQSLRYHSNIFHRDLELDQFVVEFQDCSLSQKQVHKLMCSLLSMFGQQCKEVITTMQRLQTRADADVSTKSLLLISQLTYQSLLARCLSKLWFCKAGEDNSKTTPKLVAEKFSVFVNEQVAELNLGEEFFALSREFLRQIQDGEDVSNSVPSSKVMKQILTLQEEMSHEDHRQVKKPVDEVFGWLESSDLNDIVKNVRETLNIEDVTADILRNRFMEKLHLFKLSKK